jgi:hypothetical protein
VSDISVRFTNKTPLTVAFFLNGGAGLETSLAPGQTQTYSMVVSPGVQPIVGIHQTTGETLNFTVADHGEYDFQIQDGKIVNAFDV